MYSIPNGHKNMPTSSIARPSKIYPKIGFWFENMPSGNPGNSFESCNKFPEFFQTSVVANDHEGTLFPILSRRPAKDSWAKKCDSSTTFSWAG
jgi:hypothetical protein